MENQKARQKDIDQTISDIKKLTKQVIKTCAPKKQREDELVAICNQLTSEIERKRFKILNTGEDYQAILDELLSRCFAEYAKVIGMKSYYVESLYMKFVRQ